MSRSLAAIGSIVGIFGGALIGEAAGKAIRGNRRRTVGWERGTGIGALIGAAAGAALGAGAEIRELPPGVSGPPKFTSRFS